MWAAEKKNRLHSDRKRIVIHPHTSPAIRYI